MGRAKGTVGDVEEEGIGGGKQKRARGGECDGVEGEKEGEKRATLREGTGRRLVWGNI